MSLPPIASARARMLAPALLALMLAGCAGNSQGLFGAPGVDVDPATGGQRISDQPVGGVGGSSPRGPQPLMLGSGPDAIEYTCPMVDTRSGAGAWQVPAAGGGLRYQGSIASLARECAIVDRTMTMKVGIEGRVVLGDKGTAGAVNVPIRIAVVQEGATPKTITTKFFTVPVNVPADTGQVSFTVVEDTISFPLPSPAEVERYIVYVGFDPKGTPDRSTASPRPARPRPAATTTAPAAAAPSPAATAPRTTTPAPAATSAPAAPATSAPAAAAPATPSTGTSSGGFGAPPAASSSGTFGPAPSTGAFGPPPTTFGPPPAGKTQ